MPGRKENRIFIPILPLSGPKNQSYHVPSIAWFAQLYDGHSKGNELEETDYVSGWFIQLQSQCWARTRGRRSTWIILDLCPQRA